MALTATQQKNSHSLIRSPISHSIKYNALVTSLFSLSYWNIQHTNAQSKSFIEMKSL